jgi:hypothetical protein
MLDHRVLVGVRQFGKPVGSGWWIVAWLICAAVVRRWRTFVVSTIIGRNDNLHESLAHFDLPDCTGSFPHFTRSSLPDGRMFLVQALPAARFALIQVVNTKQ